jgi:hypothetical protein
MIESNSRFRGGISVAAKDFVRKRLFVDVKLQGALLIRFVLYWLMCLFAIAVMMHCCRIIEGRMPPDDEFEIFLRGAVYGTLAFLPLAWIDLLRVTNRFAGPVLRLRRAMEALGRGEHVEPVRFRKGDFWQEFADDFNAVLDRLEKQGTAPRPEQPEAPAASEEDEILETAGI